MTRILIAAGLFAFGSPAIAQMTTAPAAPAATPSVPQTQAPTSGNVVPAEAAPTDPKAIIASEFPVYDKDGNGSLASAEFDTWMMALKEKSVDKPMKPAEKTSWLKSAFASADKDKSQGVTLAELTEYLTAAA